MAQTKRKRRSKHRGNAAGVVEARGRTGRPSSEEERKASVKQDARARRLERMNRPPTWRSAINRAAIATVIFIVAVVALFGEPLERAAPLGAFMLFVYIPLGYYTDLFLYRRRMRIQQRAGAK